MGKRKLESLLQDHLVPLNALRQCYQADQLSFIYFSRHLTASWFLHICLEAVRLIKKKKKYMQFVLSFIFFGHLSQSIVSLVFLSILVIRPGLITIMPSHSSSTMFNSCKIYSYNPNDCQAPVTLYKVAKKDPARLLVVSHVLRPLPNGLLHNWLLYSIVVRYLSHTQDDLGFIYPYAHTGLE